MRSTAAAALIGACLMAAGVARAADAFSWAPADSPAVARGREVASRFDHASLWEISVELDNAFSIENRRAIAVAEEELRRVAGVRRVFGPARLLDLAVDPEGRVNVRPVLGRGPGEREDEAARQRVVRRADALGWFLSPDGSRVRFLIDADDPGRLRDPLEQAIASSGLRLLYAAGAHLDGQALWPDPADDLGRWLAVTASAAWIAFMLVGGRRIHRSMGRLPRARRVVVVAAAMVGAAALLALSAIPPLRWIALKAAAAAGLVTALGVALEPRPPTRRLGLRVAPRPSAGLILGGAALAALAFGLAVAPGLRIATQQWRRTPFLFVSVRGDMEQPVVLREVQRLGDYLRAQPGVANAWSVADLFFGVAQPADEVSRIPESADAVRRILVQARTDPAVDLELAPDHREALVVVRFDDETPADRLAIVDGLQRYLRTELREALVGVDLEDPELSPVTRSIGKGLLAADARDRIVRICARSGRTLGDAEAASVERMARRAAVVPAADLGRLKVEITAELAAFLRQSPAAAAALGGGAAGQRGKLGDELAAQSSDATWQDVDRLLEARIGAAVPGEVVATTAQALHRRLARVRERHAARINFREMLYGADLPSEGMLADEVRSATLEAMSTIVGVPVPAAMPGAFHLDALAVGGAANDRALSEYLRPGLRWGALLGVAALALLLLMAGGGRGLLWLPVGLAPASVAVAIPLLAGEPIGMMFVSFLAGALAGGAALAASLAARRPPLRAGGPR